MTIKKLSFKRRVGLIVLAILAVFVLWLVFFRPSPWDAYYQQKLHQPPRPLVVKAVEMNRAEWGRQPHAVDFGSGVGNETLFLLKMGFSVTAIDKESQAFKWLYRQVQGQPHYGYLKTIQSDFTKIDWRAITDTDFFLASFALPFCPPEEFPRVWREIDASIKPGGLFVGQFFDPNYKGFKESDRRHMTFLTQAEVLKLLEDYQIQYINRKRERGLSGGGASIEAEYYEVIARKKSKG